MRKFRLIPLTAALLLVATGWWGWSERDRLVPVLANPFIQGARIEALDKLQLDPKHLSFEHMSLALDSGARLRLENTQLQHPFELLFFAQPERTTLTIARLNYTPAPASAPGAAAATTDEKSATRSLKFSDSINLLQKYLPRELRVGELIWNVAKPQRAQLNLRRRGGGAAMDAELLSGPQWLSLQLQPSGNQLEFSARSGIANQPPALSLSATLTAENSGRWRVAGQLEADLGELVDLPLARGVVDIAAGADGMLSAALEAQIPDQFFQLQEYRQVAAEIQADSLRIALPDRPPLLPGRDKLWIEIQLPQPITLRSESWSDDLRLAATAVTLQAQEASGKVSAEARLREIDCSIGEETRCSMKVNANSPQLQLGGKQLSIRKPTLNTRAQLLLQNRRQQWRLRQMRVAAETVRTESAELKSLALESPLLECDLAEGKLACSGDNLASSFSALEAEGLHVSGDVQFSEVEFGQSEDGIQASAGYSSEELHLQVQEDYILAAKVKGSLNLNHDTLSGKSHIQAGALEILGQWQHDLEKGKGDTEFTLAETEFSQRQPLSQSIKGLPLDLVAGTVSAKGRYSWPQPQGDAIQLTLDQVAAVYDETFAVGARGQISLYRQGEQWVTREPQPLQLDTLDVGLPVQKIHFALALDEQRNLTLVDVNAKLLGGELQSPQLVWNLAGEQRRSQVLLNNIALADLAQQMEAKNFTASGALHLQIPLITGPDGVTVEQGKVRAQPPGGRLRYYGAFSADMLASNPQLKLLAGALEDYNFRELSGTLDYPPNGDMQLELKLVGRSESVAADRDLIINLKLENNVPAMLRSLQAGRNLSEALEKRIQ